MVTLQSVDQAQNMCRQILQSHSSSIPGAYFSRVSVCQRKHSVINRSRNPTKKNLDPLGISPRLSEGTNSSKVLCMAYEI